MDKIFDALYEEIAHGDAEHRQWLLDKMQEFYIREVGKQHNHYMSEAATLSFGQKAVGVSFNPSALPKVDQVKAECAKIIDTLDEIRNEATDGEVKAQLTLAIRKIQEGQMWAVKGLTWKY